MDADLVLDDPNAPIQIRHEDQARKAGQTPIKGRKVPTAPVLTMLRGRSYRRAREGNSSPRLRRLCYALCTRISAARAMTAGRVFPNV
ncbi:MAG TPA: hypothetical protein VNR39_18570 [Pseudolabrys sp.]|nr:hypothetical protein [Pseudolabrys sp.]